MAENTAERATVGFPPGMEAQAVEAASVLAPEGGLLADIDPALFGRAITTAARAGPMADRPPGGNKKDPVPVDGPGEDVRG